MTLTMGLDRWSPAGSSADGRLACFRPATELDCFDACRAGCRSAHMTSTQVRRCCFTAFFMAPLWVVQVTVQTAAGTKRLGTAAATVQLSRALGAAVGTAIVGVVLFPVIALTDPSATAHLASCYNGTGSVDASAARFSAVVNEGGSRQRSVPPFLHRAFGDVSSVLA